MSLITFRVRRYETDVPVRRQVVAFGIKGKESPFVRDWEVSLV